jgi:hypothetical protein
VTMDDTAIATGTISSRTIAEQIQILPILCI